MYESREGIARMAQLRKLCATAGIELIERSNGHVQVKGAYLVNYYPFAKKPTIYIAGTVGKSRGTDPQNVIEYATGRTRNLGVSGSGKRPKNTMGRKRRLWEGGCRACHWCKVEFTEFEEATLEHVIPLSKGGLDNPNNTTLAHAKCNNDRGNALPHKGLRLVASK